MCANWNEKVFKPEVLLKFIEGLKIFDDNGNFSGFEGIYFYDYLAVLASTLEFNKEIPEGEKQTLVHITVYSVASRGAVTKDEILKAATKEEKSYLSKRKQEFVIVTNLSLNYFEGLNNTTLNGIPIIFSRFLPKKFDQTPIHYLQKKINLEDNPKTYTFTRTKVTARNEREAFDLAMDSLDLLRGIWNLQLNRVKILMFPRNRNTKPINKITLGSYQTIHHPNGKLVTDQTIWYEPDYKKNDYVKDRHWESAKRYEKFARKCLSQHPYKSEVEDLIRRYVRALDYQDARVSFIELWGILEKSTFTLEGRHKETVKRVAFLYDTPELHKEVLNHLRIFRNSSVHTGQRTEQIETLVSQAKRYVEDLIFFHVQNFFNFSSMEEAASFLDLPPDKIELEKRIKLLKNAAKFHK